MNDSKMLIFRLFTFRYKSRNPEFGISLVQMMGIYWVFVGLVLFSLGDPVTNDFFGILQFLIIYVVPIWAIAALTQRKK